jgi:hypothetical protein
MSARLADVEHSLRIAKVQFLRANRVETEHPDLEGIDDIIDEILSRIEALVLARFALLLSADLRESVERLQ